MWILIMATMTMDAEGAMTRNAGALATAEFTDKRACERAARSLRVEVPNITTWCVSKS